MSMKISFIYSNLHTSIHFRYWLTFNTSHKLFRINFISCLSKSFKHLIYTIHFLYIDCSRQKSSFIRTTRIPQQCLPSFVSIALWLRGMLFKKRSSKYLSYCWIQGFLYIKLQDVVNISLWAQNIFDHKYVDQQYFDKRCFIIIVSYHALEFPRPSAARPRTNSLKATAETVKGWGYVLYRPLLRVRPNDKKQQFILWWFVFLGLGLG